MEVHFEESRITVNESVGTVEVCLVKEGVTSRVITVTVVVQELLTDNSASGRHTVSMGRMIPARSNFSVTTGTHAQCHTLSMCTIR